MSQELFQMAFRRYGRVWRVPDTRSVEARAIDELLELSRWAVRSQRRHVGPAGPIYCDLIENATFNALATRQDDHEFVTLFSGAANHIYCAFFCFLSDPSTLPSVGNASQERVSQHALEVLRTRAGVFAPGDIPKDPQRVSAARALALFTCIFILLHEVGHIVRCHSTFLKRKYGLAAYEEIPTAPLDARLAKTRNALEWEADEYAAIASYQLTRTALGSEVFAAISSVDGDCVWAIAASMTFALIGQMAGPDMLLESPTHPSAFHRYLWSMLSVEGAPECKSFQPQTRVLQQGHAEVIGWLLRNGIAVQLGGAKGTFDVSVANQQFADRYASAKQVLREEQPLLDQLVDERRAATIEHNLGPGQLLDFGLPFKPTRPTDAV